MESSLITGGDVAAIAVAPADRDVRKRWLLLAAALVVGLVAAFAIGSAVKKTSAPPAPTGSLAQSSSAGAQAAVITPLTNAGVVPALHAPPPKPKPKVKKTTPANTSSAATSSSVASTSSSPSTQSSSPSTQSSSPSTQSSSPSTSAGSTSSGSTSAGSTSSGSTSSGGVTHTGGGGGGGQSAG